MSSSPPTEARRRIRWRDPAGWPLRTRLVTLMIVLLSMPGILVGASAEVFLRKTLYDGVDARLDQAMNFGRPGGNHGNDDLPGPDLSFFDHPFGGSEIGSIQLTHLPNETTIHGGLVQPTQTSNPDLNFDQISQANMAALLAVEADGHKQSVSLDGLGSFRVE